MPITKNGPITVIQHDPGGAEKRFRFEDKAAFVAALLQRGGTADVPHWTVKDADLSGIDLSQKRLHDIAFENVDLTGANLDKAMIQKIRLTDTILRDVRLNDAMLLDIRMKRGNMQGVQAVGVRIKGAEFRDSDLGAGVYQASNFNDSKFINADMSGSDFMSCHFESCTMDRVALRAARASGAQFRYLEGYDIDMRDCDLSGADMGFAYIHGLDLRRADCDMMNVGGAALMELVCPAAQRSQFMGRQKIFSDWSPAKMVAMKRRQTRHINFQNI